MRIAKLSTLWWTLGTIVVAIVLLGLMLANRGTLASLMIGPNDVEAELARRARAGDPVPAEQLRWQPERAGTSWRDFGPSDLKLEERFADLERLGHRVQRFVDRARSKMEPSTQTEQRLDDIEHSKLWSLSSSQLAMCWSTLDWLERDPARWIAASRDDLAVRQIRNWAAELDAGDPCELAHPGGMSLFDSGRSPVGLSCGPDVFYHPGQEDSLGFAEHFGAAIDSAAMRGDLPKVLTEAERLVCFFSWLSLGNGTYRGRGLLRVDEEFIRRVEACLPLLEQTGQAALLRVLSGGIELDWRSRFERHLREDRARLHEVYAYHVEVGVKATDPIVKARVERSLHAEFLDRLKDYDLVFELLDRPFTEVEPQLKELEQRSKSPYLGYMGPQVMHEICECCAEYLRVHALRQCVAVAQVMVESGPDAAASAAREMADPFDGAPLRTRLRDDGVFEIWSVGEDLVDDGGSTAAVPGDSDEDIVFRVPSMDR